MANGLLTQRDCRDFGLKICSGCVPHSYALSGIVYIVPGQKREDTGTTSPADAMKFSVSGGVSDVHEQIIHEKTV